MEDVKGKEKDKVSETPAGKNPATAERLWVGFDLGGTKMLSTVFDENFKPLARERKKTKGHEGADTVVKRIIETIKQALRVAEKDEKQIAGIGIGCPGPVDTKRGVVIQAPNLDWRNVEIRKILKDEFKTEVIVCNDVDAGVYGEYRFGSGKGAECLVGIFPGTGVGGGCVYQGKIFQGRLRSCMEIGHIPICSDTALDGAGNSGTVEAVASRLAIAGAIAQASFRGKIPSLNKKIGTTLGNIRSGVIADAVAQDEQVVKKIVQQAGEHLSLAIVTLIHLLSPDVIVLGGGLVEAMPEFFLDLTERRVGKRVLSSFVDTYEIRVAKLGDDATVMGAAAWARQLVEK